MTRLDLRHALALGLGLAALATPPAPAGDNPPPVPVSRPDVKETLEGSKRSQPRLPLPPLTDEEKAAAARPATGRGNGLGGGVVNNGRMQKYYIADELRGNPGAPRAAGAGNAGAARGGAFLFGGDPSQPLDPTFRVMFFWIIARTNNCYYCLGHQEVKLKAAGVSDDKLAALDTDWSEFTPAERAAFTFVRKLGRAPELVGDDDLAALRRFYNDKEILDIIVSTAGFAQMTRWTGGLNIPQEDHRVYLTPTAEKYREKVSLVAPIDPSSAKPGATCTAAASARPALESRDEVAAKLAACRSRSPRLPLVGDDEARALLPEGAATGAVPQWVRLLANFPQAGKVRVQSRLAIARKVGDLDQLLRAQIAWVAARQDRAWYAAGHARARLKELGQTDDQIFALDGPLEAVGPGPGAALSLAKKLTVDPALVTDADVEAVRKHYSDRETAEVVYLTTAAAFFDRVTEAAGLALEPEPSH